MVVQRINKCDEPPSLRLLVDGQQRNVSDKDGVKQPGHLQVVAGAERLEIVERVLFTSAASLVTTGPHGAIYGWYVKQISLFQTALHIQILLIYLITRRQSPSPEGQWPLKSSSADFSKFTAKTDIFYFPNVPKHSGSLTGSTV